VNGADLAEWLGLGTTTLFAALGLAYRQGGLEERVADLERRMTAHEGLPAHEGLNERVRALERLIEREWD